MNKSSCSVFAMFSFTLSGRTMYILVQNLRFSSYSFSLLTIKEQTKFRTFILVFPIEYNFLPQEIRYLTTTQSVLTLIVLNNSKSIVSPLLKQQQGA